MAMQKPFWDVDYSRFMGDMKFPSFDLEALIVAQRRNVEALAEANKLAFEGLQAVGRRQAEIARQSVEQMTAMMSDLMAPAAPEQRVGKQAELAKQVFEKAVADFKEIGEMVAKSNAEATSVLSRRFTAGLDELKGIARANGAEGTA